MPLGLFLMSNSVISASSRAERLQKYLSRCGIASRRGAEELITQGQVLVNGARATLGMSVTPSDTVTVRGEVCTPQDEVTYVLYKPRGYVCSRNGQGKKPVHDLLPAFPRVEPVGRLDVESEGLLLMTTSGDLLLRLTHPRYGHEKRYLVTVQPTPGWTQSKLLDRLRQPIKLADGPAQAEDITIRKDADRLKIELTVREGRNHLVRRMMGELGLRVTRLVRIRMGTLELGELKPGSHRKLTPDELAQL